MAETKTVFGITYTLRKHYRAHCPRDSSFLKIIDVHFGNVGFTDEELIKIFYSTVSKFPSDRNLKYNDQEELVIDLKYNTKIGHYDYTIRDLKKSAVYYNSEYFNDPMAFTYALIRCGYIYFESKQNLMEIVCAKEWFRPYTLRTYTKRVGGRLGREWVEEDKQVFYAFCIDSHYHSNLCGLLKLRPPETKNERKCVHTILMYLFCHNYGQFENILSDSDEFLELLLEYGLNDGVMVKNEDDVFSKRGKYFTWHTLFEYQLYKFTFPNRIQKLLDRHARISQRHLRTIIDFRVFITLSPNGKFFGTDEKIEKELVHMISVHMDTGMDLWTPLRHRWFPYEEQDTIFAIVCAMRFGDVSYTLPSELVLIILDCFMTILVVRNRPYWRCDCRECA